MKMQLASLNEKGVEKFADYLLRKAGEEIDPPFGLLDDDDYAQPFEEQAEIEKRTFETSMEMAEYLCQIFDNAGLEAGNDRGMWGWLTLFFIEQLIKPGKKPGKLYRYIPDGDNYRHYYRHLVASACKTYAIHGEKTRAFLSKPVYEHGDYIEQLAARQEIITNKGLVEAADFLYYDSTAEKKYKRGALTKDPPKPGALRRFITVVDQFDLTFDLYGMDGDQILDLFPPEFDPWKPTE